jgi:predicted permease
MPLIHAAFRSLIRHRTVSVTIVAMLAVGIGSISTVFDAFDAILLRPLPVRHPKNLVRVVQNIPYLGTHSNFVAVYYQALKDTSRTLFDVFGQIDLPIVMTDPAPAEQVRVHLVTPEFFEALGSAALLGRTLTLDDDREAAHSAPAVLSYGFWRRRFGGESNVIGRTIGLHGHDFVIVGVMPLEFNGISVDTAPDVRVPIRLLSALSDHVPVSKAGYGPLELCGRLRKGVSRTQAQAECSVTWYHTMKAFYESLPAYRGNPSADEDDLRVRVELEDLEYGVSVLRPRLGTPLKVLIGAVALLQLIICANVAGLLLARAEGRRMEMAIRAALGSSRIALVWQLLVESTFLAAGGTAGGLLIALLSSQALTQVLPPVRDISTSRLPLAIDFGVHGRLLLVSTGICVISTLLFGLVPALGASRQNLNSVLRSAHASTRWRGRQASLVFQVALCTFLLALAGVVVRTFKSLRGTNLGFDASHTVTFTVEPQLAGYTVTKAKGSRKNNFTD